MMGSRWIIAATACAGPAAVLAFAPFAQAAPQAGGAMSPTETIYSLAGQGYDVQFNWVDGEPANMPLAMCSVTNVDTSVKSIATVSLDCPSDS